MRAPGHGVVLLRISEWGALSAESKELNAYTDAWSFAAHKPSILLRFRLAFDSDRCDRVIGCVGRQAGETNPKALLLELDYLPRSKKPGGGYFGH